MNIILLSGGSGKRLWPLSNDVRSKQFIQIFKTQNGYYESMVQRVYRQIKEVDKNAMITIATSKSQVAFINKQLGEEVGISVEPCRKDTFLAIVLAITYLSDIQGISEEEAVVICPVDCYVNDDYFKTIKKIGELAQQGEANIVLMGIKPTYPSEKYGYIVPQNSESVSKVLNFKEKPDIETAKKYIAQGALWNAGVFAFKINYLLRIAHELIEFTNYQDLYNKYGNLQKISFDYAVLEKEKNIAVKHFAGVWNDVGTWNTLTETLMENNIGFAITNETCENVHIINELDIPVLCIGLKNVIVSASTDGILVSDKEQSSYLKSYVDNIDQNIMFKEKSWGNFQILNIEDKSLTIKITLNSGCSMTYHSHKYRDEIWTVISGKGKSIVNGEEREVKIGDTIFILAGCKHTLCAETELKVIEVQIGKNITVYDKQKYCL